MNEPRDSVTPEEIEATKDALDMVVGGLFNERFALRRENAELHAAGCKLIEQLNAARRRQDELEIERDKLAEELETLKSRQPPERKRPWWARVIGGEA